MSEAMIAKIADEANMIIAGFSYTFNDKGYIRVLNLNDPEQACVLFPDGTMIETTMDDSTLALVQAYYLKNREFMEVEDA